MSFYQFETKTAEEINKERFYVNIASSVLALSFLTFFMFIDKIPVEYVLKFFSLLTEGWFKIALVLISIFFLFVGYLEKNFSYVVLISVFLTGHFLFLNVYDDQYSIELTVKKVDIKNKNTRHYYLNLG